MIYVFGEKKLCPIAAKKSFDKNGFIVHSYRVVNSGKESEDRKGTRLIPLRFLFLQEVIFVVYSVGK